MTGAWLAEQLRHVKNRTFEKKKYPFHSSHAVDCYNSSDRDCPRCFDAFKRLVAETSTKTAGDGKTKTKLLPRQLQGERLEHLEYMHPIVRPWLNYAHADKNDDGVLWRKLLLPFE